MESKMNDPLYENVRQHIQEKYTGIFTPEHMERHFRDYVGLEMAETQLQQIRDVSGITSDQKLLDIGCGYGSFVLVARNAGILAEGIDIADYDIGFARKRLTIERPMDESEKVYHLGDGQKTDLPSEEYNVITAWNLLEHVPNFRLLIQEAYRLLIPGGVFIAIAPNYLAFRQEAHYHVPWLPLFPRSLAHQYLIRRGLDPKFFDTDIHYTTSWGIESALKVVGFQVSVPENIKLNHPELIHSDPLRVKVEKLKKLRLIGLVKWIYLIAYWNPFKPIVYFIARKS